MTFILHPLDEALRPALLAITPAPAETVTLAQAINQPLAEDLVSPGPVPDKTIALIAGYAVQAVDLIGATGHAPVPLAMCPARVNVHDTLPAGCNAVIEADCIIQQGPLWLALNEIAPGTNIRRLGHDLASGAIIARQNTLLTPEMALAAAEAGISFVKINQLAWRCHLPETPATAWLARYLPPAAGAPSLILAPATSNEPKLALSAAERAGIQVDHHHVTIEVPRRFDAVVACWCAIIRPLVLAACGIKPHVKSLRIKQKITSSIGMTEIALLAGDGDQADVLATGDLTLAAIARADAFVVIPAHSEGFPPQSNILAESFGVFSLP